MASPEDLKQLDLPKNQFTRWRGQTGHSKMDFREADLSNRDLSGMELKHCDFSGANLTGANFEGCHIVLSQFAKANLSSVNMKGIKCHSSVFDEANLTDASLELSQFEQNKIRKARFNRACLTEATLANNQMENCIFDEADMVSLKDCSNTNFNGSHFQKIKGTYSNFTKSDLCNTNFHGSILDKSQFKDCIANNAKFNDTKLSGASFHQAKLNNAAFCGADLTSVSFVSSELDSAGFSNADCSNAGFGKASLIRADIHGTVFFEADLSNCNLEGVKGAHEAKHLETTKGTAKYFDKCERKWPERLLDWEHLRQIGQLRIFGVSYIVLAALPAFFYGLAFYNQKVEILRTWALNPEVQDNAENRELALIILEKLHQPPIPNLSLLLFTSMLLLACASTIFALGCPQRIKESTLEHWCYQLGHSRLHYWPYSWKRRFARLTCAGCYYVGGIGALIFLITKLWWVFDYIIRNSTLSTN